MASRLANDGQSRPDIGDILLVVHDFQARSSDELSLVKGDKVELIERDDEFGDGWFLGRHLANGNTGLFPEVYTRPIPKTAPAPASLPAPTSTSAPAPAPASAPSAAPAPAPAPAPATAPAPAPAPALVPASAPTIAFTPSQPLAPLPEVAPEVSSTYALLESPAEGSLDESQSALKPEDAPVTLPLNSSKPEQSATTSGHVTPTNALGRLNNTSQDSQVLNETLNVINEHITDLRSPSRNSALRTAATDSGSEYSASIHRRASYIQGEETDEEEERVHDRAEVQAWSADQVAEYLFTSGVEKHHCEVFRDQEITGEVLLGMDQTSLFLKAFDLGSVGRRLKTWQKIKALIDEVNNEGQLTARTTQSYGSELGSEGAPRIRSRTNTLTNSMSNRPMSIQSKRLSMSSTSPSTFAPPVSPMAQNSPTRPGHTKRPSAASIRELNHSRRHSSTDFLAGAASPSITSPKLNSNGTFPLADKPHRKQPSFDRNWTLGNAFSQSSPRPLSSTGMHDISGASEKELQDSAVDLDRGYFSGTEADGRKRNVLRKRDSHSHSKKSSYTEEQRVRSATAMSRQSRLGSMDSFRDGAPATAAQRYYGIHPGAHRRTASTATTDSILASNSARNGGAAPPVTKLEAPPIPPSPPSLNASAKPHGYSADWLSSFTHKPTSNAGNSSAARAISESLEQDRSKPPSSIDFHFKDHHVELSSRTGSTTPSADHSFELDSPDATKSPNAGVTAASKNNRKKGKKETSAYTRGLLKVGPKEAIQGADYSGWMRKKSSNLMTTWKPRFFVLKGRRLSYYYSDNDQEEKGLIDISFHRVLPADNERLTGFHATITGAANGPAMPASQLPGSGDSSEPIQKGDDSIFIFKLVPPRAGLSRAVNFTKPTVHYFAVPNLQQGRLWMAALMKATIDRDDSKPITTTYQQKTISLAKAKQMRHRPPALMNLEESKEEEHNGPNAKDPNSLGIFGEADSGVSGIHKQKVESARLDVDFGEQTSLLPPQSA
ncbi:hypothetical protein S7711_04010 [Stachybotrys chartarum IBT 7711]|uniref:Uncharacterized protein n=1 Tax=Stachybotrys chartarum (strain CBS 109288 / IBT 7711) TaxID=1280523 RepID=A0A084AXG3_STACB|nr:hypothetical protein S7711_04010 [Stachybotrys chartarum IBT 7711]